MEFEGLARQAGNPLVSANPLKANLDSKKTLTAANFIMDMVNNGEAKTAGEDIYGDKNFTSGKTLFYAGSSAGITNMKQMRPKTLSGAPCHYQVTRARKQPNWQATILSSSNPLLLISKKVLGHS